jgi:membrane protein YqaA with SNARE-associated domain
VGNASVSYLMKERRPSGRNSAVVGASLVLTVAICILVVVYWEEVVKFSKYGYIGDLIISFLAGVTVLVPVPSVFVVFTLGAVLNPILVGLIAGAGETLGSMVVYMTGLSSARAFHALDHGVMEKFRTWIKTRGAFSVFVMSSIFNPLFYPFTAIAGMMHFGWWRFLILCLAGKSLKNILVAGAGFYGMKALLELFGGKLPL